MSDPVRNTTDIKLLYKYTTVTIKHTCNWIAIKIIKQEIQMLQQTSWKPLIAIIDMAVETN